MKLQLLAIPLLLALMLSPLAASAVTGTVIFTSPASGASYSGTQSYSISGSISPAPTLPDNVAISVTNPGGQVVDFQQEAVQAGGSWTTYTTNVGGNPAQWTQGTYTVTVSDSNGATGSTTFKYTTTGGQSSGTTITVVGNSNSLVYSGQTAQIYALAYWNNGTAVKNAVWTVAVYGPSGSASSISWTKSSPASGVGLWTGTVPAASTDGVYAAEISATEGGITGWTQTSFDVNSQVAPASGSTAITNSLASLGKNVSSLSASIAAVSSAVGGVASSVSSLSSTVNSISSTVSSLSTTVTSLSSTLGTVNTNVQSLGTSVASLSSTVNTISTSVSSLTSSISTLTTDVTGLQTTVNGLGNLSQQMAGVQSSVTSLNSSVSNSQTYILVVAALAVITLVLELAILIRKMS